MSDEGGLPLKLLREYDEQRSPNFCANCQIEIFGQPAALVRVDGKILPLCEPCAEKRLPPLS